MNKIIICDKNKELINKLKKIKFENKYHEIIISDKNDVFEVKKEYPEAKIVTASNPDFSPNGGLDKQLHDKYPAQWENAKEFYMTKDLFFVISCDADIKSSKEIVQRCMIAISGYSYRSNIILTGIGTGVAGLNINTWIESIIEFDKRIFNNAKLNNAELNYAKLNSAELIYAELNSAKLNYAELIYAKLNNAELIYAKLNNAKLNYAELNGAELNNAELSSAKLSNAKLNNAELIYAKLIYAELNNANLSNANLSNANLNGANISDIFWEYDPLEWINNNFKKTKNGYIVYKAIGNTTYAFKKEWEKKENSILKEVVNRNITNDCGCGVNFGTKEYCQNNYPDSELWECFIPFEQIINVIVPINTDGKARCEYLQLLKKIM